MKAILILLLAATQASCSLFEKGDLSLVGEPWRLWSVEIDDVAIELPKDESYTFFLKEDTTATGTNDCNECTGFYQLGNAQVQIQLACTESGCRTPVSSFLQFPSLLSVADSFQVAGKTLRLFSVDRRERRHVLTFRPGS